jgi:hypothetical protein
MCSEEGFKIFHLFVTRLLHLTLNSHGQFCAPIVTDTSYANVLYKCMATLRVGASVFIASSGEAESYH